MGIKIAIDAGHGSNTAGKRTPDGYREHWINVKCANYCADALKRCGFEVEKVAFNDENAKDDSDVSLSKRQAQIKKAGCAASVSFHANASGDGKTYNTGRGVETLVATKDNQIGDSLALAKKVQTRLIEGTEQKNRGVKRQDLAMCNCPALGVKAAILVEIGFMTNKEEADLMKTDVFCKEQAEEVAHGICDYFGKEYKKETVNPSNATNAAKPPYFVKVANVPENDVLNIRKEPKVNAPKTGELKHNDPNKYTIIEEMNGWGKLKSGIGWINLFYTKKA